MQWLAIKKQKADEKPPEKLFHKQNSARNIKAEHCDVPFLTHRAFSEWHEVSRGCRCLLCCSCVCAAALCFSLGFLSS